MPENKPPVAHYDRGRIQFIEYVEGSFPPEAYQGFLAGTIIKYLSRFKYKGTPEADLIKAQTYLGWLLEAVKMGVPKRERKYCVSFHTEDHLHEGGFYIWGTDAEDVKKRLPWTDEVIIDEIYPIEEDKENQ